MTKNELINKILRVDNSMSIWKLKRLNKKELNYILKRSMLNHSIIKRKSNDSAPIATMSYRVKIKTTQTKKMINKEKKILELSMLSGVDYKSLFKEIETKYTIPVDWIIDFYKARGAMPNKKEEKLINDNGVSFALNILKIADNYTGKELKTKSKEQDLYPYRIKEKNGVFYLEKESVFFTVKKYWWSKSVKVKEYGDIDRTGDPIDPVFHMNEYFETLAEAEGAILSFKSGLIYHYKTKGSYIGRLNINTPAKPNHSFDRDGTGHSIMQKPLTSEEASAAIVKALNPPYIQKREESISSKNHLYSLIDDKTKKKIKLELQIKELKEEILKRF